MAGYDQTITTCAPPKFIRLDSAVSGIEPLGMEAFDGLGYEGLDPKCASTTTLHGDARCMR